MDRLLSVQRLSVEYPTNKNFLKILDDINIDIFAQDFVSIIGETGCGKTTLVKAIINLLPSEALIKGEVFFYGLNLLKLSPRMRKKYFGIKIGVVFQDSLSSLNPTLKIKEQFNIVIKRKYGKTLSAFRHTKTCEILNQVGLYDFEKIMKSYPAELSEGMNQRINIALSLLLEPDIMFFDEPTSSLDASCQDEILRLIKTIYDKKRFSVVFITHDILLAQRVSNKIIVMKQGTVIEFCEKVNGSFTFTSEYAKSLFANSIYPFHETYTEKCNETIIDFYDISKRFLGKQVLLNFSFSLYKGECLGIIGNSGTGKSTICKMLCGIYKPDNGQIIMSKDLKIEMIFQNATSALNPKMIVRKILNENKKINREKNYDDALLREIISNFEFDTDILDRQPFQLSGGQKQKIAIIRCLLNNPDVIIFDEPTSSLDVITQKNVLDFIYKIKVIYNLTYIFITHNPEVIKYICDRIVHV